jgi:hypothetical protein
MGQALSVVRTGLEKAGKNVGHLPHVLHAAASNINDVSWMHIIHLPPPLDFVALTSHPPGMQGVCVHRDLVADIDSLQSQGVVMIVSLLLDDELRFMGLNGNEMKALCSAKGIEWKWTPLARKFFRQTSSVKTVVALVLELLAFHRSQSRQVTSTCSTSTANNNNNNKSNIVVIHCNHEHIRSGAVVACLSYAFYHSDPGTIERNLHKQQQQQQQVHEGKTDNNSTNVKPDTATATDVDPMQESAGIGTQNKFLALLKSVVDSNKTVQAIETWLAKFRQVFDSHVAEAVHTVVDHDVHHQHVHSDPGLCNTIDDNNSNKSSSVSDSSLSSSSSSSCSSASPTTPISGTWGHSLSQGSIEPRSETPQHTASAPLPPTPDPLPRFGSLGAMRANRSFQTSAANARILQVLNSKPLATSVDQVQSRLLGTSLTATPSSTNQWNAPMARSVDGTRKPTSQVRNNYSNPILAIGNEYQHVSAEQVSINH